MDNNFQGPLMRASVRSTASSRQREALDEYQMGLVFYRKRQWKVAARHFSLADHRARKDDVSIYLYQSYQGLCRVLSGDVSGLNLCRHASSKETLRPEVFLNLSIAELKLRHRKRACSALRRGLGLDPRHSGLLKLRSRIGVRRTPCLAFLSRDNPLNIWLGRLTYQPPAATNRRSLRHSSGKSIKTKTLVKPDYQLAR